MQISWHGFHVLYIFLEIGLLGFHLSKAHSNIYISTKPRQVYNNKIWPNGCVFINNNK
jgi:hypothetical protein